MQLQTERFLRSVSYIYAQLKEEILPSCSGPEKNCLSAMPLRTRDLKFLDFLALSAERIITAWKFSRVSAFEK